MNKIFFILPIVFQAIFFSVVALSVYRMFKDKRFGKVMEYVVKKADTKDAKGIEGAKEDYADQKYDFSIKRILKDSSMWMLLFSNILAIFFILKNHVPMRDVLLVYWVQSVAIGIINFVRILSLRDFSVAGLTSNGVQVEATEGAKRHVAFFFLVHYGLFHAVYAAFILAGPGKISAPPIDWSEVFLISSTFLFSHVFSFVLNFKQQTTGKNLGKVMFSPYTRIVPMHLAIIFGVATGTAGPILLGLKALIDMLSHVIKHAKVSNMDKNKLLSLEISGNAG